MTRTSLTARGALIAASFTASGISLLFSLGSVITGGLTTDMSWARIMLPALIAGGLASSALLHQRLTRSAHPALSVLLGAGLLTVLASFLVPFAVVASQPAWSVSSFAELISAAGWAVFGTVIARDHVSVRAARLMRRSSMVLVVAAAAGLLAVSGLDAAAGILPLAVVMLILLNVTGFTSRQRQSAAAGLSARGAQSVR